MASQILFVFFLIFHDFSFSTARQILYCMNEGPGCETFISIFANPLTSANSLLTLEHSRIGFCSSTDSSFTPVNLGQIVFGDRLQRTSLKIHFGQSSAKTLFCNQDLGHSEKLTFIQQAIKQQYNFHLYADDFPLMLCYHLTSGGRFCSLGIPVGCYVSETGNQEGFCLFNQAYNETDTYYIFNHLIFTVEYEPVDTSDFTYVTGPAGYIVQIMAFPVSESVDGHGPVTIKGGQANGGFSIPFSYNVTWQKSGKWMSRWKNVLDLDQNSQNILQMNLIIVVLCCLFCLLCLSVLHQSPRCLQLHAWLQKVDEKYTLDQWKMKHDAWTELRDDIFCSPGRGLMLAILTGSGLQMFCTIMVLLVLGCTGLLSPANRGMFGSVLLFAYVSFACLKGYCSSRIYLVAVKQLVTKDYVKLGICLTLFCPGLLFCIAVLMNLVHLREDSAAALDVWYILQLKCLWFGVDTPLTFLGVWAGFRPKCSKPDCSFTKSPPAPQQQIFLRTTFLLLLQSVIVYSVINIPCFYIFSHIWLGRVFYAYEYLLGFFFCALLLAMILSNYFTFLQLCQHNYHWWWHPFSAGIGTSAYYYFYSTYYYFNESYFKGIPSAILYFGYNFMIAFVMFLVIGSVCFFSTWAFLVFIYRTVHQSQSIAETAVFDSEKQSNKVRRIENS